MAYMTIVGVFGEEASILYLTQEGPKRTFVTKKEKIWCKINSDDVSLLYSNSSASRNKTVVMKVRAKNSILFIL
jgi:hypothetical protein